VHRHERPTGAVPERFRTPLVVERANGNVVCQRIRNNPEFELATAE
jgi:hypothetical protein